MSEVQLALSMDDLKTSEPWAGRFLTQGRQISTRVSFVTVSPREVILENTDPTVSEGTVRFFLRFLLTILPTSPTNCQ